MACSCLSEKPMANVPHTEVELVGFPNPSIAEFCICLPLIKCSHSRHKSKWVKNLQHVKSEIFPLSQNVCYHRQKKKKSFGNNQKEKDNIKQKSGFS